MHADKVIWKDGLFVLPQHFQQFERYLIDILQQTHAASIPYMYGFTSCNIDTNSLANGIFTLARAEGLMPDGTPFRIPDVHSAPFARSVDEHFGHQRTHCDVFLTLPLAQPGRPVCSDTSVQVATRYKTSVEPILDEVSGSISEEIEVGKCNFLIRFDSESMDGLTSLRIARLRRTVNEGVFIDEAVSPILLSIAASSVYLSGFKKLLAALHAKGEELLLARKQIAKSFSVSTPDEIANHLLLTSISTYTPLLDQLFQHAATVHPHRVYNLLGQLTGALQAFGVSNVIKSLPPYDHFDPGESFNEMKKSIDEVLGADYSSRSIRIPIERSSESTYVCTISDSKLLDQSQFYLGISADTDHDTLINVARRAIKMSSIDQLQRLTIGALPGLSLNPVVNPPAELATKKDFIYFNLLRDGEHWNNITETGNIAFSFPNNLTNLSMELLAVKMH